MQYFSNEYLEHHGILGQKWGVRRFQNPDGSLTNRGRKRAARLEKKVDKKYDKAVKGATKKYRKASLSENVLETLLDKGFEKTDPNIWKYDPDGKRYDGKPYTKKDKAFLKQESKENIKAYKDLSLAKAKINYERKIRDIRKSEIKSGYNYWERVRNRNIALALFSDESVAAATQMGKDIEKYRSGLDARANAYQEYKDRTRKIKERSRQASKGS